MGLIDLKTNLKSLKYGNDQRGGGSSNQPYIVTPIPEGFADTSPDFLLRNGYLNPISAAQDVSRLTKLFADTKSPNGLLFVTKQELLERQNVVVQNGFNRIYNPLGTLAQAGVISTGYHLNKQGLNPFARGYFDGGRNGYYQTTLDNSNGFEEGKDNRLYALYKIKQTNSGLNNTLLKDKYEISSDPTLLISYGGGPGSVLGFGKTNIRIQNPTRTVIDQKKVIKTYKSLQVKNVGYLTPSGSFIINWNYDPTIANNGVTKQYLKEILKTDGDFGDLLNNNMLNRDTSTVIPIGKPANTFVKSQDPLKSEPGYLRIGPIDPGSVNWVYNPSYNRNPNGLPGVSVKYTADLDLNEAKVYETFYTSNPSNLLNRDTSIATPIGKSANTFNKNSGLLKLSPDYLRTGPISGNITWVYKPIPGPNDEFSLYQELQIRTGISPDRFDESDSIELSKVILNRTGLEGENAPKTIYPSSSIISRGSYYKTKNTNALISSIRPDLINSIAFRPEGDVTLDNEILNNISQSIPDVLDIPDDIVQGKKKTTTLSSLNPKYFILNKNNTVSSEEADAFIKDFNREKTYKTSPTVYSSSIFLRDNVNKTDTTYSDGQNVKDIIRGSRGNQIEQANSDLIKFFFEINNNDALTDTQNWFLFFRAYLNDFGDSYKADWQSYKYIGRAENFYKYGGFSRDISLGFTVYAHTRAEMVPIYNKLNYLVGTTAPDYSKAGYMRGNFVNLTIGDYLDNVPGIINDISLKPSFDAGWDIDRDVLTGTILQQSYLQLPKLIEVSMTFTPIHSFTPQFEEGFIRNAITPNLLQKL